MSKKSQKQLQPVRPGERTWQGTRGYTWSDDRKYVAQSNARDFFRFQ